MSTNRRIGNWKQKILPDTLIFPLRGREIKSSLELELQMKVLASTVISQLPEK